MCVISWPSDNFSLCYQSETSESEPNRLFITPCDIEIVTDVTDNIEKQNRDHSCATSSFVNHFIPIVEFKLEFKFRNAHIGSKSVLFLSHVTLTFGGWPWKAAGHLFYGTSGFVHYFVAICVFKLVRIHPVRVKIGNFLSGANLKFDRWPSKPIGHLPNLLQALSIIS